MQTKYWRRLALGLLLSPLAALALSDLHTALFTPRASLPQEVMQQVQVGDVVFTREPYLLLRKVADAGGSWTNHVGVVIDVSGPEPIVAESKVPFSRQTPLSHFVHRSQAGYVAVRRPAQALTPTQATTLAQAAQARMGRLYDLGFNLDSPREFCSKLVYESLHEATGQQVGEVTTFAHLLQATPGASLGFWKVWYFGQIPWSRRTVTPASQYHSTTLVTVYDETLKAAHPGG